MTATKLELGEHATITCDGKTIGWIVETDPCTLEALRCPFVAGYPSKLYGIRLQRFGTYHEAEEHLRRHNDIITGKAPDNQSPGRHQS